MFVLVLSCVMSFSEIVITVVAQRLMMIYDWFVYTMCFMEVFRTTKLKRVNEITLFFATLLKRRPAIYYRILNFISFMKLKLKPLGINDLITGIIHSFSFRYYKREKTAVFVKSDVPEVRLHVWVDCQLMCYCTTIKVLCYLLLIFLMIMWWLRDMFFEINLKRLIFFKTPIFKNGEYEVKHDCVMILQDLDLLLSQGGVFSEMATN